MCLSLLSSSLSFLLPLSSVLEAFFQISAAFLHILKGTKQILVQVGPRTHGLRMCTEFLWLLHPHKQAFAFSTFFSSKSQFLLPEPKMPILGPGFTTGDKVSGLYVVVVSLMLCCWAWSAHSCDHHVSTDWANGTSVRDGSGRCRRRGA